MQIQYKHCAHSYTYILISKIYILLRYDLCNENKESNLICCPHKTIILTNYIVYLMNISYYSTIITTFTDVLLWLLLHTKQYSVIFQYFINIVFSETLTQLFTF